MTVTLLLEDLAEQLAAAEDAGFARGLSACDLPDIQRWELMQANNRNHDTRKRLYVARLRIESAA